MLVKLELCLQQKLRLSNLLSLINLSLVGKAKRFNNLNYQFNPKQYQLTGVRSPSLSLLNKIYKKLKQDMAESFSINTLQKFKPFSTFAMP